MSEFIRPSLYHGKHPIILLKKTNINVNHNIVDTVDIVGPVCESGDFLGKDRKIKNIKTIKKHDLFAICHVGAYGFVMSSNYNSRPKITQLLINNMNNVKIIKHKQTIQSLYNDELDLLLKSKL